MSVLDASKPDLHERLVIVRDLLSCPFSRLARERRDKSTIARRVSDRMVLPAASVPPSDPVDVAQHPPFLSAGNIADVDHLESRHRLARDFVLMVVQWSIGFVLVLAFCVIILAFGV
ncbi:hypothetical protein [Candidatus Raskinella chloraquaticus]|uniref:Uncharacterized protein n=1 Tax=Candidatus Raskinella chloraquaticus TaxID=1951219 RepID=A0A1W9HVD0_9HYPH|nr:MAG: hypothetical protein A4S15_11870 [Proteobacteria bacterium SG_bin8]